MTEETLSKTIQENLKCGCILGQCNTCTPIILLFSLYKKELEEKIKKLPSFNMTNGEVSAQGNGLLVKDSVIALLKE